MRFPFFMIAGCSAYNGPGLAKTVQSIFMTHPVPNESKEERLERGLIIPHHAEPGKRSLYVCIVQPIILLT